MPPSTVHLPNGMTLSVSPVFGGLYFKANELNTHHNVFPAGWTIILNCEDDDDDQMATPDGPLPKKHHIHRFKRPSLRNDHMFISSISNPASSEFRPPTSPTRQIAMMLWATLYWYFHQHEPPAQLITLQSEKTPQEGKPKGDWRVNINREGIFKGKHLLPKLERMGLIASEDSSVGLDPEESMHNLSETWSHMFVSRRSFWQLDPRIYLFTLSPLQANSPFPPQSPATSRPASPVRSGGIREDVGTLTLQAASQIAMRSGANTPPGPFHSSSHLPTYYPPPPPQYTFTNHTKHPIRPKPPRQGETFYTRYIPSLQQYLSFRIASLSPRPVAYNGPLSLHAGGEGSLASAREVLRGAGSYSDPTIPTIQRIGDEERETVRMTDVELLHKWMNDPRVAHSWGEDGSMTHHQNFLRNGLSSKHSVPVIGCFDGKPFGYFEIYWVKEDRLGQHLGGDVGDWDRGLHALVGEQEFRGFHRVKAWLSALVHYCWIADPRTNLVMLEPRVDNEKLRKYCEDVGFYREREISLPHKQSNLMKIRRDAWDGPAM